MNNDTLHEAVEEDDIKRIRELSTYNHAINLRQKNKEKPIVSAVDIAENLNHQDILNIFDRVEQRQISHRFIRVLTTSAARVGTLANYFDHSDDIGIH